MPTTSSNLELPPAVRRILDAVRRQIRTYVWVEGLAILVALFGAAFWIGLLVGFTAVTVMLSLTTAPPQTCSSSSSLPSQVGRLSRLLGPSGHGWEILKQTNGERSIHIGASEPTTRRHSRKHFG